jgi:hypothetical protein
MSRGRLIFPKLVEVARFDSASVADAGDFDTSLHEIVVDNPNTVADRRIVPRREVPVRLRAQIETDTFLRLSMGGLGAVPGSRLVCVFFGPELEELGFIDPETRTPALKTTDRLAGIFELDERLILRIDDPPGLYATSVKPCAFGFGAGGYNLVEVLFESRPSGIVGSGGGGGGL